MVASANMMPRCVQDLREEEIAGFMADFIVRRTTGKRPSPRARPSDQRHSILRRPHILYHRIQRQDRKGESYTIIYYSTITNEM